MGLVISGILTQLTALVFVLLSSVYLMIFQEDVAFNLLSSYCMYRRCIIDVSFGLTCYVRLWVLYARFSVSLPLIPTFHLLKWINESTGLVQRSSHAVSY